MHTYSLDEAAAMLRCSPDHLRKLASGRQIPATKVGRRWLFVAAHLEEWLKARYAASGQPAPSVEGSCR